MRLIGKEDCLMNKRISRDLKQNFLQYFSYVLLISLSIMVVVGFNKSMDGYTNSVNQLYVDYRVQDGFFQVRDVLSEEQIANIEAMDIVLEDERFLDVNMDDGSTIRVFPQRENIDSFAIFEGRNIEADGEILLDSKYAGENGIEIGGEIEVEGEIYVVVGLGITPDYVYTLKNSGDMMNSPSKFGIACVSSGFFEEEKGTYCYSYGFLTNGGSLNDLKKYLIDNTILLDWILKSNNARIQMVYDDVKGPKVMASILGFLLLIVIVFVIATSVKNKLDDEKQTIGILYAQGVRKGKIIRHYLAIPCILALIGSVIGFLLSFPVAKLLLNLKAAEYTLPNIEMILSPYLIFISLILPTLLTIVISYLVLNKQMAKPVLQLIRDLEDNTFKKSTTKEKRRFLMRFRIRELSRDVVSVLLLLVGVLICSLVMITAFYLRDSATHYIDNIEENLKYDYIYTLKYQPIQKLNLNDDSEIMVISTFLYDDNGSEREFMVQGINANSKFYDMSKINVMQEDEIIISSCVAQKYGYEVNDSITLKEKLSNKKHHFKIIDIYNFDFSQICFTSQENINNLLNVNKEYYNGIIASEKENLDDDYIYSISTKSETVSYANNLIAKIKVISSLILVVSVILLISIIFLMLKMVIEKNKTNIALVKIFGYTRKEIKKLYTSGNIIIVIAGFLLANPLAYMIAKKFYIGIFATSQQFFVPYINFYDRWIGLTVAMIGYGISIFLLNETILKVKFSEVLKSRE